MMTFILFLFVMYWLPTLIAIVRQTPSALGVAMLNFFLGWTVVGWIVAFIWACAADTRPVPVRFVPVASSGRFCSQCGSLSLGGAHYCSACGRVV